MSEIRKATNGAKTRLRAMHGGPEGGKGPGGEGGSYKHVPADKTADLSMSDLLIS